MEELLEQIKQDTLSIAPQSYQKNNGIIPPEITLIKPEASKPSFSEITPFAESTVYKTLDSGEKVRMFEDFIPGTDNEERLAQQQSSGDKWANGVIKFGTKTTNAVLGGTAGLVYGVGSALSNGSFSSLYDNDFSNWLNDLDTKTNYQFSNYYTEQEKQKGLVGQMGTANFWSDKFLGGLSFTVGALASEGIWAWATGGTSLATSMSRLAPKLGRFARWGVEGAEDVGQVLNATSKYKRLYMELPDMMSAGTKSKDLALGLGKTGEISSAVGFMARSAGYEASVEALQFKKEAEEKFYTNFSQLNGREPNTEDIAKFNKDLESRANTVFGANMAILGVSNLAMMGSVLDIKNPIKTGLADFIDRKAFGYGLEKTAEGSFKAIERTGLQKASRFTFNYVAKPALTEGIFEEGGQGLVQKYNSKWLEHTYDSKLSKETFDSIGAFNEAIGEQYGTKEGWVENGLGILIGIAGGSVNARSEMKQAEKELDYKKAMANTYQDNSLQQIILPSKVQTANRVKGFALEAKDEALKGNVTKSELAKKSGQLAFINGELVMGSSVEDITNKFSKSMDVMTTDQWKEAGIENVQEYKNNALAEINTLAKEWKTNKKYWQYIIGDKLVGEDSLTFGAIDGIIGNFGKNASIVEALAWQSTIGENANKIMDDVRVAVSYEVGEEHAKTLDALKSVEEVADINAKQLKLLQNQNTALKTRRTKLTNQIAKLDVLETTDSQKAKRAEVTKLLLETEEAINGISSEANGIADKINTHNANKKGLGAIEAATLGTSFSSSSISSEDLLSLDKNIEDFQNTLKSLEVSNPQRAKYLNDLLDEYSQAKNIFLKSQATNRLVSSKDFKLENIGSYIGGKIAKNKAMNVDSQEWLQEVLNDYANSVTKRLSEEQQPTEEVTPTEEDNTKTKPKSQEQISQEKINALEAERRQKLAEVEDLIEQIKTEVEVDLSEEDKRRLEDLPNQIQNLKNKIKRLTNEIESLNTPQDTDPLVDQFAKDNNDDILDYKKVSFQDADAVVYQTNQPNDWSGKGSSFKQTWNVLKFNQGTYAHVRILMTTEQKSQYDSKATSGFSKELRELAKKHRDSDNAILIDIRPTRYNSGDIKKQQESLKNEIENINDKISQLEDTLERTKQKEGKTTKTVVTENRVTNQAEIDKINKEYDAKINALKPKSQNPLEQYKQRLENLLKTRYKDLISVEDETKPTQEEIQTFKEGKANDELKAKLSRWKLYDASVDEDGVSVADLITWINQEETTIEANDTKTDVTESEAWTELKEDDENGTDYSVFKPELGVNQTAPATLKYDRVKQNYELTHIRPEIFVQRLGDSYTMDTKAKSIDKLKVGDSFEIRGVRVEIGKGKRLILKKTDFESLESDLNMFSIPTDTINWTFTDIYEETGIGQPMRKVPSQFVEKGVDYLNNSALFNSQKGDKLTLYVKSTSEWNASKDGGTLESFEIMLRDKDGQDINVLKAFRVEKGEPINQQFFALREEAFRRWEKAGRPDKLDLDMSVEIAQVLIGSPELNIIDRKVTDIEFTKETAKTIRAKGYILNGELTLDRPLEGVSTAYIGRISKKNPGLKQPFVVIQRGVHLIAVPISVTQRLQPVDFDGIYNSTKTPQQKVILLNDSIIKNNIEVDKVMFEDIYDDAKMQIVKQAFENKKVFVTADTIADKNYRQENLVGNASIKIDLTNLDQVFNAGKIKIRLDETINFGSQVDVLEDYGLSLLEKGSDLADEIYDKIYNSTKKISNKKNNDFIKIIINKTKNKKKIIPNKNKKILKKGTYTYNQRGFNILLEANKYVGGLSSEARKAIGTDLLRKADQIIKRHDLVMKNLKTTKEEIKSGLINTNCP